MDHRPLSFFALRGSRELAERVAGRVRLPRMRRASAQHGQDP